MRSSVHRFLIFCILALPCFTQAASSTNAQERHQQFQTPEQNNEALEYEWSGGTWQYESISGSYRFIVSRAASGDANKLYLQWWRQLQEGGKELSYSVSVKELNRSPVYAFSRVDCLNAACSALKLKLVHVYEEYEQNVFIDLVALGRYRISW